MPPRLLFVHPHPDDESIACGGVIAAGVAAGHDVHVVTCTGGEEGENQSGIDLGGVPMDEVRRREMRAALSALGDPAHSWLGFRDSGMAGAPSNDHPDAFAAADLYDAAARLAGVVRRHRPHVVVSDDARGTYGHPDHVTAHRVTERAVAMAADPWWSTPAAGGPWQVPKRYVHAIERARVWAVTRALRAAGRPSPFGEDEAQGPQDLPFGHDEVTAVVDVGPHLAAKRAAMAAHASQIGEGSFFLNTPDELAEDMFGVETFVLTGGTVGAAPDDDGHEHDLLAGVDVLR